MENVHVIDETIPGFFMVFPSRRRFLLSFGRGHSTMSKASKSVVKDQLAVYMFKPSSSVVAVHLQQHLVLLLVEGCFIYFSNYDHSPTLKVSLTTSLLLGNVTGWYTR